MSFGVAEVALKLLVTSNLYLTSEPSISTSVFWVRNIILKRSLHCDDDWSTNLSVSGWSHKVLFRSLYTLKFAPEGK